MSGASARRRYALVSFLTWLPAGLMIAPLVLLMLDRGLTLVQVGVVMTVYSLVIAALELPTGGLADVAGRRVVLAVAAGCTALALALLMVATSFWAFVAAATVLGVSRALSSGPAEAWFVDTLHAAEGDDADLRPGLSRGHVMEDVALGVGVLAGGFAPVAFGVPGPGTAPPGWPAPLGLGTPLPGWLVPLAVPALLGAVAALVWLVVVLVAMPEPPRARVSLREVLGGVPVTVAAGVRLAARDGVLRRLVLVAAVIGVALTCVELLVPGHLAGVTGSAELGATAYAVVSAVGFAGGALGSGLAPALARRLGGSVRGTAAGLLVAGGALAGLALAAAVAGGGVRGVVLAGLPYLVFFAGLGAHGVLRAELGHHRVTSAERATMASASSLAGSGGAALANLTLAPLAMALGVSAAWWLVAAVVLASALLLVRLPVRVPAER
ncbi:MFS transporter [Nonomuraea typhae]|uniref:MFS transporter n=1 Tax=Nonomuraea typhae TaxID=2603600 RepID=UPI0012FA727F|nr:MFS transporter [Nonomuraea typhae]